MVLDFLGDALQPVLVREERVLPRDDDGGRETGRESVRGGGREGVSEEVCVRLHAFHTTTPARKHPGEKPERLCSSSACIKESIPSVGLEVSFPLGICL